MRQPGKATPPSTAKAPKCAAAGCAVRVRNSGRSVLTRSRRSDLEAGKHAVSQVSRWLFYLGITISGGPEVDWGRFPLSTPGKYQFHNGASKGWRIHLLSKQRPKTQPTRGRGSAQSSPGRLDSHAVGPLEGFQGQQPADRGEHPRVTGTQRLQADGKV